eukprot:TRINITY_DN73364_c0_g1_i1.p1 TRINITY_DN73364_c0_g1~~TRINITY_DN73364_c0_g1_i1.p1  ORF type:complete len:387 (-),score=19.09 TRINITY_DN73364_c0_g1_i1:275-1435(-)
MPLLPSVTAHLSSAARGKGISKLPCAIQFVILFLVVARMHAEPVTYSGYLVDNYCHGLVLANGRALDGSDVLTDPSEHLLHCLRDIPACRAEFYLARREEDASSPSGARYPVKFLLDTQSQDKIRAFLDTYPQTHKHESNFTVTVQAEHRHGGGILSNLSSITRCTSSDPSSSCDTVCMGACEAPLGLTPVVQADALLYIHVVCMCLSWGCLLPLGVICAHFLRKYDQKIRNKPFWFQSHRICPSLGVLLQTIGFIAILIRKRTGPSSAHEIIGVIVVFFGLWQPFNAILRNLSAVGHPGPAGERTRLRVVWEGVHKGGGYSAIILGLVNILLGLRQASNLLLHDFFQTAAAVHVAAAWATLLAVGVWVVLSLGRRHLPARVLTSE